MLISEDPRELFFWKERFAEVLSRLTPDEVAIAGLRLEGLSDDQIAALRGVSRSAVSQRMLRASRRIACCMPEMEVYLSGRRRATESKHRSFPLDWGWICNWDAPDGVFGPQLAIEIDLASRIQLTLGIELLPRAEPTPRVELALRIELVPGIELVFWIALSPWNEPGPGDAESGEPEPGHARSPALRGGVSRRS